MNQQDCGVPFEESGHFENLDAYDKELSMASNKPAPSRGPVPNGPSKTGKPSGGGRGNLSPKSAPPPAKGK